MTDQQRLAALLESLKTRQGIGPEAFEKIAEALRQPATTDIGPLRLAFFDARSYEIAAFNAANSGRFAIDYIPAALSSATASQAAGYRAICLFVNDTADAGVVRQLATAGVELIALRCAGYNNVDLAECRACGIGVVRVPAYSPHAVAEHTLALMLMLNRKLHLAYLRNRTGAFLLDGLIGFDMYGKTVGVVGTGAIGRCAVAILHGMGCRVLAHDKFPDAGIVAAPSAEYVDLATLLRESDVITLHVPLFPETRHLISAPAIATMKDGVMLINTSRGSLVDTTALIAGLKSGKIGSAGLDVYEEEAGVFFHDLSGSVLTDDVLARLLTFNNVVVTSHQAFLTHEALGNIAATTLSNLDEFVAGKRGRELTNVVG